jgi:hypothetical protein
VAALEQRSWPTTNGGHAIPGSPRWFGRVFGSSARILLAACQISDGCGFVQESPMYVLTIVMLFSSVTLVSTYSTQDACEEAARTVRQQVEGPQAVRSATCAYVKGELPKPGAVRPAVLDAGAMTRRSSARAGCTRRRYRFSWAKAA